MMALFIVASGGASSTLAQSDTAAHAVSSPGAPAPGRSEVITLVNGVEYEGMILSEDSSKVTLMTTAGVEIAIPSASIKSREAALAPDEPRYIGRSHLYFSPTAIPLRAGEGYFAVYELFFPFVAIGVTDYLTLAGGISLVPGLDNQIFYVAPKIAAPIARRWYLGVGGLLTNSFSADDDAIGLVYALTSYGDDAGSATVGVGWGFSGEDFSDKPGMVVGFDLEAGGSIRFVSENWIPSDFDAAIISIGIRFVGDPVTADLALVYPSGSDSDGFPFIPWLGFAFAF